MLDRPDAEQADHPLTLTLTLTQGEPCLIVQITLSPSPSPRRAVRDCQGAKQGMHGRPGAPRAALLAQQARTLTPTLTLTLTQVRQELRSSLSKLRRRRCDLLLLHWPAQPIEDGVLAEVP